MRLPIAADGVDGERGQRRGCGGRRSPHDPRSSTGARSVVSPTSLFSKIGRPRARRGSCGPDLDALIQTRDLRQGQIMLGFLLSFCNGHMRAEHLQRGKRKLVDEALTKRSKCDDSLEQKVLLRCATEMSDSGVSRLMLAITWARSERTCTPARGLESSVRMLPHCARARSCRGLLAARRRPDRGLTWPEELLTSSRSASDHWLSSHFGFYRRSLGPSVVRSFAFGISVAKLVFRSILCEGESNETEAPTHTPVSPRSGMSTH